MDRELYGRVSAWFDAHREQMTQDIARLVRIPSISAPQEGDDAPFGEACRECLEEMLAIGREHGFCTENYENRVGSIGGPNKDWDHMIGFWNHMDVVPVGGQWVYEPFSPVVKEHFLIGRGAQDNKGPAVGILYVMECLRELKIPVRHELRLFVGCDEERGMEDLEYYTAKYPTPRLSMIADSGFPVCYGEKGILEGRLRSRERVSESILRLQGGSASNMIPDAACAELSRTEELSRALAAAERAWSGPETITLEQGTDTIRVCAHGKSKHSAFPEGSINAIHGLLGFLAQVSALPEPDRKAFGRLARLSEEFYGENLGIACRDEASGRTTCAATVLALEEGIVSLLFNVRYAISADQEKMLAALEKTARENGLRWESERNSAPNDFPKEHPAVKLLTDLYNEITGEQAESFCMGGGTYARKLPNAFAYGVGGMKESEEDIRAKEKLFLPGHGGAHEPDEGLNLRLLTEAMKIYTMAVVELNRIEL